MALLALLKGLPMAYNRDLQEDKEPLFDTADTVRACVQLMGAMLQNATVNRDDCAAAAGDPALLATDLADYLVRKRCHSAAPIIGLVRSWPCPRSCANLSIN